MPDSPEPNLRELLDDPLVHALMARDGVHRQDVLDACRNALQTSPPIYPEDRDRDADDIEADDDAGPEDRAFSWSLSDFARNLQRAARLLKDARSASQVRLAVQFNQSVWESLSQRLAQGSDMLPAQKIAEFERHARFVQTASRRPTCPNDDCLETFITLGRRTAADIKHLLAE